MEGAGLSRRGVHGGGVGDDERSWRTGEGMVGSNATGEVADLSYQIAAEPAADDAR